MNKHTRLKVAVLAASIALAMNATSVMAAAPTATQLPGQGKVVSASTTVTSDVIDPDTGNMSIGISGAAVINWGKGTADTDINNKGVAGFNVGADVGVTFTGAAPTDAVLNIDSSGNASQIFGDLTATNVSVFVANANGVIVGKGANVNGTVGLIANTLSSTAAGDFAAGEAGQEVEYSGTGGDVTVQAGAHLNGTILVSGGGTVNVDAGALAGTITLSAGLPSGTAGGFATSNDAAMLTVAGDGSVASFTSAGDASSSGTLTIDGGDVAGTFTNNGTLSLADGTELTGTLVNKKTVNAYGLTLGGLTNDGEFTAYCGLTVNGDLVNSGEFTGLGITVAKGNLTNNGVIGGDENFVALSVDGGSLANKGLITAGGVSVTGGDLANDGTIGSDGYNSLTVTDGSIVNNGKLLGFPAVMTQADEDSIDGADYSITNNGTLQFGGILSANALSLLTGDDDGTTGSFTNTGTLQFMTSGDSPLPIGGLSGIAARNDINFGGAVQVANPADDFKLEPVSADNPLPGIGMVAVDGDLTVSSPIAFATIGAFVGKKVKLLADVAGGDGSILLVGAGDKVADDYAIRIGSGATVSADIVGLGGVSLDGVGSLVTGDDSIDLDDVFASVFGNVHPNVMLQGTLAGNQIYFGADVGALFGGDGPSPYVISVSDVFSGPHGGIVATGDDPLVEFAFTGRLKAAPYLNDANFRYNGLPITVADDTSVHLQLDPIAYQTNGTSNGLAGVNLLVNGSVDLNGMETPDAVEQILETGSSVAGLDNWENTHLVLQSTGRIDVGSEGSFYWPGYVYLGTIDANADGSPAPGTLGLGQITLEGDFSNVLPASLDNGGGIHFISQFPLQTVAQENVCFFDQDCGNGSIQVSTNGGSWVNFGTDLLTQGYATGTLSNISFQGGVQGPGTVVNYGELDASMFHTHVPVATR